MLAMIIFQWSINYQALDHYEIIDGQSVETWIHR